MSTSINVNVEPARLINSSRQQTAANRFAFQDRQARARAEEKGLVLREANRLKAGAVGATQYGTPQRPLRRRNDPAANRRKNQAGTLYNGYFTNSTGATRHTFKVRSGVLASRFGNTFESVQDGATYTNQSRTYNLSYTPPAPPDPYSLSPAYLQLWQEAASGPAWVPGSVGQLGWEYFPVVEVWSYQKGYTTTGTNPVTQEPETVYYTRPFKEYFFSQVTSRIVVIDRPETTFFDSRFRLSGLPMPANKFLFYYMHRHTNGASSFLSGSIVTRVYTRDELGNELSVEKLDVDVTAESVIPNVTVQMVKKFEVAFDASVPSLSSLVEKSSDLSPAFLDQAYQDNFSGYPGAAAPRYMEGTNPDYSSGDYEAPGGSGNE
jgi:hypothetical protein